MLTLNCQSMDSRLGPTFLFFPQIHNLYNVMCLMFFPFASVVEQQHGLMAVLEMIMKFDLLIHDHQHVFYVLVYTATKTSH